MPGAFDTFIGNGATVAALRATIAAGRISHAYLLTGPDQSGKRTLARAMAAALICTPPPEHDRPCGECRHCRLIERDAHPDVRLVAPVENHRNVTIEQVRQVERDASLRPSEAARKVFIIRGVDGMAAPAANALLKTLEEPPEDTVLLLTTADTAAVLPTILSRCRETVLRPAPAAEIAAALVAQGQAPEAADVLARMAGGRPGWAIAAAADPALLEARREYLATLETALAQPPAARLPIAGTAGDAAAALTMLDGWLGWWRDAMLVQQGCADLAASTDRVPAMQRLGRGLSTNALWQALVRTQQAREQIEANVNVRLAVEALLLDLPECDGA